MQSFQHSAWEAVDSACARLAAAAARTVGSAARGAARYARTAAAALLVRLRRTAAARPRRRRTPGVIIALIGMFAAELRASLARLAVYAMAFAALGLVVTEVATKHLALAAEPDPRPDWVDVVRPIPAFALALPDSAAEPRYAIQRHAAGGRKDIFTFRDAENAAAAVVEIYRPGAEAGQWADTDETTASTVLSELRLSGAPVGPRSIETKFGPVAVDEFTDQAADGARRCLVFRRGFDDPRLEISGWFCNAGLELVDHGMVACALDHLTLLSAASEPKLGVLFARAELKRSFCGQKGVLYAATPRHMDWIEAARDPRLRGRQ